MMGHPSHRSKGAGHRFKAHEWDAGTSYQMPSGVLYLSEPWRKWTVEFLERHPDCFRCKRMGYENKARVGRHIKPRAEGLDDYDPENVQALCLSCIGIKVAPLEGAQEG